RRSVTLCFKVSFRIGPLPLLMRMLETASSIKGPISLKAERILLDNSASYSGQLRPALDLILEPEKMPAFTSLTCLLTASVVSMWY
ncbi:MAG: hypothetical protein ABFD15_03355, partial [Methanofastidiosum sp.]